DRAGVGEDDVAAVGVYLGDGVAVAVGEGGGGGAGLGQVIDGDHRAGPGECVILRGVVDGNAVGLDDALDVDRRAVGAGVGEGDVIPVEKFVGRGAVEKVVGRGVLGLPDVVRAVAGPGEARGAAGADDQIELPGVG